MLSEDQSVLLCRSSFSLLKGEGGGGRVRDVRIYIYI